MMQVEIISPYGRNSFAMPRQAVMKLLALAFESAPDAETPAGAGDTELPGDTEDDAEEFAEAEEEQGELPADPYECDAGGGGDIRSLPGVWENPDGYKGFLYMQCEVCGKIRGFCLKSERNEIRCVACGHISRLNNLLPMYVSCKCGKNYKYRTNMDEDAFNYTCINCGSRVRMRINSRRTAYVTARTESKWRLQ